MNNNNSQTSLDEVKKIIARIKARNEFIEAGFNLHAMANKCPQCGHQYRVKDGDLFLCEHAWRALKTDPRSIESDFMSNSLSPQFKGLNIIVEDVNE